MKTELAFIFMARGRRGFPSGQGKGELQEQKHCSALLRRVKSGDEKGVGYLTRFPPHFLCFSTGFSTMEQDLAQREMHAGSKQPFFRES
jgi:hypothetical protein